MPVSVIKCKLMKEIIIRNNFQAVGISFISIDIMGTALLKISNGSATF